jgi:hypothetical protein
MHHLMEQGTPGCLKLAEVQWILVYVSLELLFYGEHVVEKWIAAVDYVDFPPEACSLVYITSDNPWVLSYAFLADIKPVIAFKSYVAVEAPRGLVSTISMFHG